MKNLYIYFFNDIKLTNIELTWLKTKTYLVQLLKVVATSVTLFEMRKLLIKHALNLPNHLTNIYLSIDNFLAFFNLVHLNQSNCQYIWCIKSLTNRLHSELLCARKLIFSYCKSLAYKGEIKSVLTSVLVSNKSVQFYVNSANLILQLSLHCNGKRYWILLHDK